jgi:hypothetical protein
MDGKSVGLSRCDVPTDRDRLEVAAAAMIGWIESADF